MIFIEGSDPHGIIPQQFDDLPISELQNFREHKGLSTRLCEIEGRPEFLVRVYDKSERFLTETIEGFTAVYDASSYGVNVLPSRLFFANGVQYAVTTKVDGQPLSEILTDPTDEVLEQTDTLYSNLGSYVIATASRGGFIADDIYWHGQYMYGETAGDATKKIRLVDLPDTASFVTTTDSGEGYNRKLMEWVNGIIEVEDAADTTLKIARLATTRAFEISSRTVRGAEWVDAFKNALKYREPLDTDEPPIDDLCTY